MVDWPVPREKRAYSIAKRSVDFCFSAVALVCLSPLLLLLAIWVRIDSAGPVFYCQERLGRNGKPFLVYKFRSMRADAESTSGPVWARKQDDRITRSGRIMRKLYLDELPQLINIFLGQMSLVGPRPERAFFYPQLEKHIPGFSRRLSVTPGLTGLAQVRHYHEASIPATRKKFIYDMIYIKNRSFMLDLFVIWRTIVAVINEAREVFR